jgi:hypothetical protein
MERLLRLEEAADLLGMKKATAEVAWPPSPVT